MVRAFTSSKTAALCIFDVGRIYSPTIISNTQHTRLSTMASSYENLPQDGDDEFDESQIDFTDIEEQFQVRLDEGLDAFVVIDGLPVVPEDSKGKLVKFVLRKLNSVGKVKEDGVHMPVGDSGKTEGYVGNAILQ